MLKKNVYILFPAGYGGSYVSWAISISDRDLAKKVPIDPINLSSSTAYGGTGTAHHHVRIPTHQGIIRHLIWSLYNRPSDPKIYVINPVGFENGNGISIIAKYDPDGIFINIHDDNDRTIKSYGEINCVTKWPTFVTVRTNDEGQSKVSWKLHDSFDPYNCSNDRLFRNFVVESDGFFSYNGPLSPDDCKEISRIQEQWYKIRNQYQPHEINPETYLHEIGLDGRVFNINCKDIAGDQLPDIVESILKNSGISDDFDTNHLRNIHFKYKSVQKNLQWFSSYQNWKETGILDNYLLSHSIIQSQILREILDQSGYYDLDNEERDRWISFYVRTKGIDWPEISLDPRDFWDLPKWVQQEILDVHGYELPRKNKPKFDIRGLDWKNMDIIDINDVYQTSIN